LFWVVKHFSRIAADTEPLLNPFSGLRDGSLAPPSGFSNSCLAKDCGPPRILSASFPTCSTASLIAKEIFTISLLRPGPWTRSLNAFIYPLIRVLLGPKQSFPTCPLKHLVSSRIVSRPAVQAAKPRRHAATLYGTFCRYAPFLIHGWSGSAKRKRGRSLACCNAIYETRLLRRENGTSCARR
jgi:hypothetical protein